MKIPIRTKIGEYCYTIGKPGDYYIAMVYFGEALVHTTKEVDCRSEARDAAEQWIMGQ